MAKHRVTRTSALAAMSVAAATTIGAALLMGGSAGAADDTTPTCPNGYLPAIGQNDPTSTLCVTVGQAANGNIHAIVRIDPALCAHVAVGTNPSSNGTVPRDAVRTLRCPKAVPTTVTPVEPPVTGGSGTGNGSATSPLPVAPAPVIVGDHLPVTH